MNRKPVVQPPPLSFDPASFGLVGDSAPMRAVCRLIEKAAQCNSSVLLLGETGTGKELVAAALHRLGPRRSAPFVRVNCGALPETLLDSELFGHVRGSFTDAVRDRTGRFEAATGGTIFLDEINSTSTTLQVKLLRVLQEREFERVGDSRTIPVDVRVIAASNRDLAHEISEGRFREDLYWRLNVLPVHLPALRRRKEDLPALLDHFLRLYSQLAGRAPLRIETEALAALIAYDWPGNVRELQNYVERAVVLAESDALTLTMLPECVSGDVTQSQAAVFRPTDQEGLIREFVSAAIARADREATNLHDLIVNPVEKELLSQVLQQTGGVQTRAAERMGINRNTLYKKLKEHGLEKDE